MLHVRAQLRQQAKARLLADAPAIAGNVFVGRTWPTGREILPCALVYTVDEPSIDIAFSPVRQQRLLTLKVECRANGSDDEVLLDLLDDIASQVEASLLAVGAFAGLAKTAELTQTTTNTTASSDSRYGELELSFRVEYHTAAGAPDDPI